MQKDGEKKMIDREKVISGLEWMAESYIRLVSNISKDALSLLKAQEPVEANCEHRCNKCKFYEGVHNVMGHAPCSLWKISGVMWNDYCSRFNLWKEG